jgi:hypothetical protein
MKKMKKKLACRELSPERIAGSPRSIFNSIDPQSTPTYDESMGHAIAEGEASRHFT